MGEGRDRGSAREKECGGGRQGDCELQEDEDAFLLAGLCPSSCGAAGPILFAVNPAPGSATGHFHRADQVRGEKEQEGTGDCERRSLLGGAVSLRWLFGSENSLLLLPATIR